MTAELDMKKNVIQGAINRIKTAASEIKKVQRDLKEIGIEITSVPVYVFWEDTVRFSVYMDKGITDLSIVTGNEIDGNYYSNQGRVVVDGIEFIQSKLPVERVDRYA
jgi:hypothetical protein